ncbi:cardiotrophin-like cytokine factor 1, partial [Alosa sapidissima]|uniref:cardiotrophin-like cytokine factor 1 n=1 Tax=Alosa sapidissima TaxID=34773 RepID=UPI001C09EA92
MSRGKAVCCAQLTLLLAAVVGCVQVPDLSLTLTSERTTIERTYELTKYLEHQLKDIKDTYLSYLGPPFSDPDFSPPRPNSSSLSVPSAATRVELWRGLENGARLAQNQRAYRVLLCAMRELARSTLCPYLQSSLLHFCSGLNGLLGSITGLMRSLGYTPPQLGDVPLPLPGDGQPLLTERVRSAPRGVVTGQHSPAPLRSQHPHPRHYGDYRPRGRDDQRYGGGVVAGGAREEPTRRRDRE